MNNKAASFKAFEALSVSLKGGRIVAEFNGRVEELSLGEWKQPEKVADLARRLGIPREMVFLKMSEFLDSPQGRLWMRRSRG